MSSTNPEIETRTGLFSPIRKSRDFTALWLGQSLSSLGDNILFVVVPIVVYELTGSTLAMGLIMTLFTIPQIVLLPFTGLMVDRFSRIGLMIGTDIVRFLMLSTITVINMTDGISMPALYVFAVLYGAMDALFQPAYSAARQQVFTPNIRNAANSLTQAAQTGARLLGPTIGGFLLSFGSVSWGLGLDAATFIISILSLLRLRLPKHRETATHLHGPKGFLSEMLGGVNALKQHPWLWITILAFSVINIAFGGIILILLPWLVKVHLGLPAYAYGLVTSGEGLGAILAAWLFGRKSQWQHRGLIAYTGVACSALGLSGLALVTWLPVIMLLSAISGAGIMVFALIWEGSLQELVPTESFGRVVSLDMFGSISLLPVGYMFIGWLAGVISGTHAILFNGLGMLLLSIGVLLVPSIRRFN